MSPFSLQNLDFESLVMPPGGPFPEDNTSVTFTSPDGISTGNADAGSGSGTGEYFSSFGAVQAAAGGNWALSATRNGVVSTYNYSVDLSAISGQSIPTISSVNIPPYGTPFSSQHPTFQWSDSGTFTEGYLDVYNPLGQNIHYHADLPVDQNSWTVPSQLPNGSYIFSLQLPMPTYTVPLTSDLLTGPDLNLPSTASFGGEAWLWESFTIVPEPVATIWICSAGICLLRSRRNRIPRP